MVYHGQLCIAFEMDDAQEAWAHMSGYELVERYGDTCNGHPLHTWDDGMRFLARCRKCGGYILVQKSEFHGYDDDYYTDFFPVTDSAEAQELNINYDGFALEHHFPRRYLKCTNLSYFWSK